VSATAARIRPQSSANIQPQHPTAAMGSQEMTDGNEYTSPPPAPSGAPASEDKTMALIAHLLGIITWFIGPLVIWLINKDQSGKAFVIDQSKEALNFQITVTIAFVISFILTIISLGLLFFLPTLVGIANLVFCIIGGIKANNGEAYRYPFALRLIK
jgi:uncharacterized Tic20 family protein